MVKNGTRVTWAAEFAVARGWSALTSGRESRVAAVQCPLLGRMAGIGVGSRADMNGSLAYLHGGPLDGTVQELPGNPDELMEFTHESREGTWYVEYRRDRPADDGWHYQATGGMDRQDEE